MKCIDEMTEWDVQIALAKYVDCWRMICIPNLNRWHEMDFIALTKAGYLWEYEIKVEQRDWNTDCRKDQLRHPDLPACGWNRPRRTPDVAKRFYYSGVIHNDPRLPFLPARQGRHGRQGE